MVEPVSVSKSGKAGSVEDRRRAMQERASDFCFQQRCADCDRSRRGVKLQRVQCQLSDRRSIVVTKSTCRLLLSRRSSRGGVRSVGWKAWQKVYGCKLPRIQTRVKLTSQAVLRTRLIVIHVHDYPTPYSSQNHPVGRSGRCHCQIVQNANLTRRSRNFIINVNGSMPILLGVKNDRKARMVGNASQCRSSPFTFAWVVYPFWT